MESAGRDLRICLREHSPIHQSIHPSIPLRTTPSQAVDYSQRPNQCSALYFRLGGGWVTIIFCGRDTVARRMSYWVERIKHFGSKKISFHFLPLTSPCDLIYPNPRSESSNLLHEHTQQQLLSPMWLAIVVQRKMDPQRPAVDSILRIRTN